jgi:hypothetical protein
MPGVDIEVIKHMSGNKTRRIKLTTSHLLEYLRLKRVKLPACKPDVKIRVPNYDEYNSGELISLDFPGEIEITFYEQKK